MMDPETNEFTRVSHDGLVERNQQMYHGMAQKVYEKQIVVRGKPMKADVFYPGEIVTIKNYMYKVESIDKDRIAFSPVGPIVNKKKRKK